MQAGEVEAESCTHQSLARPLLLRSLVLLHRRRVELTDGVGGVYKAAIQRLLGLERGLSLALL
jgi:hypothetical protein